MIGGCASRVHDWAVRYPTTDITLTMHPPPSLVSSKFLAMDLSRLHHSRHPGRPSVCGASSGTSTVHALLAAKESESGEESSRSARSVLYNSKFEIYFSELNEVWTTAPLW